MALWNKLKTELDRAGRAAQDALDEGKLRLEAFRARQLADKAAQALGYAVFRAKQAGQEPDWDGLKLWADRMGELRQTIVWGVGRHGPGNDAFFMVRDPDGNLAEVSAEIESCAEDRPAGRWPHEERTLNLWGKAIMRS